MSRSSLFRAFLISLVFLLLFSWSTSPLYLTYGGDSPFFQIIGLGITQGKIPYVDLFDHKGPVPFFHDALGSALGSVLGSGSSAVGSGRLGIFILQLISMTISMWLMTGIASLAGSSSVYGCAKFSDRKAIAAVLLALIPLADFITEGNQVEEWQLPFVALSLYLICKYLVEGKTVSGFPLWKSLVIGACFGMVFMNRPNDGVMWVGSLYFGLFLLWIVRKEYRRIVPGVAAFIAGFAVVAVPILAWFGVHDALDDLWYGMITHNLIYAADEPFTWGGIGTVLIPLVISGAFLLLSRERKEFRFILIPMLVFVAVLIGKRDYYHYLIPFTPYIVMTFAACLARISASADSSRLQSPVADGIHRSPAPADGRSIQGSGNGRGWKIYLWVVCVLFAVFSYRECSYCVRAAALRPVLKEFYAQSDELFDRVPEAERNTVWNYNLVTWRGDRKPHLVSLMGCFPHRGLTPSSPVLAAYDLYHLEDRFGVRANNPKWLMMCPLDEYDKDFEWIEEHYELVAESPTEPVCALRLYKRKM